MEYNKNFRLILHTKLSNPHYPPEIQAETTLINFTVTESGLEDQLLALVVNKERPDLEETKTQLIIQNTDFTIKLKQVRGRLCMACACIDDAFVTGGLFSRLFISFSSRDALLCNSLLGLSISVTASKASALSKPDPDQCACLQLEDDLLYKLSSAEGDMTEDLALIESLEESKRVADEISEKVAEAKTTEEQINEARNKVCLLH